jgi:DNA-binding transcriptional LysR family regulator
MNLSWLEDFLALAASGNFSRAAQDRHMTQPAFSRRIRALEDWLGVPLFDRTTHPVALTETGEWFRATAQEILGRVARVPDEARAVAAAGSATLRFAATHALSLTSCRSGCAAWNRARPSGRFSWCPTCCSSAKPGCSRAACSSCCAIPTPRRPGGWTRQLTVP